MIKNYIFDFGNVLAEFCPDKLTAPFVKNEKERKYISEIVFDRLYWDRLDAGTITDAQVKSEICIRVPKEMQELACSVYDGWIENLTPVDGMQQLVADIGKTDKRMFVLSNISIGFAKSYDKVSWIKELLSHFDGAVFSGTVGMVKPDTKIFRHLLYTFGIKADESLFIDDSPKNIEGAERIGIRGYLFDGNSEKLREYLNTHII